jgi:hypothetical protein
MSIDWRVLYYLLFTTRLSLLCLLMQKNQSTLNIDDDVMNKKANPSSCKKSLEFRKSIMIKLLRGGRASRANGIVSTLNVTGYDQRFANHSTYVLTPHPHRDTAIPPIKQAEQSKGRTTKNPTRPN